ncbi:MAG TPA: MBL fold metallo-hydrolase [Candidatus Acidoferrales bacterium]|nr:MBL fold metallo-hydrolase [Candidatus Acidoferrales bacterium]
MPESAAKKIIHEILPVGMLQCNCSIIGDPETREALVVDPGDETARILETLAKHALTVKAIVSTHAHIDHVGGLRKMQQATGAPVLMHADDMELYRHLDVQAAWLGMRTPDPASIDKFLREGDTLRWGGFEASVLHTPGHTPGSISLYLSPQQLRQQQAKAAANNGILLAGDTLFAGSIGRTDLPGGSLEQILRSIHHKLLVLPDETIVYPGHGIATTIGEERATNPFLNPRISSR